MDLAMYTENTIPNLIDFNPPFETNGEISRLLEMTGKAEETLRSQKQIHQFLKKSWSDDRLEIILAACRIQTWSLKKDDIVACLSNNEPSSIPKETAKKIQNYARVLDQLNNRPSPKKYSLVNLKEIHQDLRIGLDSTPGNPQDGGEVRKGPFVVSKLIDHDEKIIYVPPTDKTLSTRIDAYFDWLNYARSKNCHPYLIAIISHHHLMELRPFAQDNGKVARIFMRKLLHSKEYPWRQVLPYERIYSEDRNVYYKMLDDYEVRDRNFTKRTGPYLNQWICYHLAAIGDFLQSLIKNYVSDEKFLPPPKPPALNNRQKRALRYVDKHGAISTKVYVKKFRLGRYQAYMDLNDLVAKGKLLRIGDKGRSVIYKLSPY
jgi:Fic family protein